jgi:hypothetical protein
MLKKDLIKISLLCKVLLKEEGTRKGGERRPKDRVTLVHNLLK